MAAKSKKVRVLIARAGGLAAARRAQAEPKRPLPPLAAAKNAAAEDQLKTTLGAALTAEIVERLREILQAGGCAGAAAARELRVIQLREGPQTEGKTEIVSFMPFRDWARHPVSEPSHDQTGGGMVEQTEEGQE